MIAIRNDHDYRLGYAILNFLTKVDHKDGADLKKLEKHIVAAKRELRAYAHRGGAVDVGMGFMVKRRIFHDNGIDGYVELVSIPEVFDTVEDADEFFKDFLERHYIPSAYDCTGQAFTDWYKLFRRNGQFWAYHSVSFDD